MSAGAPSAEPLFDQARHLPLRDLPWNASEAEAAIEEIVGDALAHLDRERFWPAHPQDEGIADGHTSFYVGATGMFWALDYLARSGATKQRVDLAAARAPFGRGQ